MTRVSYAFFTVILIAIFEPSFYIFIYTFNKYIQGNFLGERKEKAVRVRYHIFLQSKVGLMIPTSQHVAPYKIIFMETLRTFAVSCMECIYVKVHSF